MSGLLTITRRPYEEPYHLNLLIHAADGHHGAELEILCHASDLTEVARGLRSFPKRRGHYSEWELGSERSEDRFGFYFRLGFRQVTGRGDCVVEVRFNNNQQPPDLRIAEFSFPAHHLDLERLADQLWRFSCLEDEVLEWRVGSQP